VLTIQSSSNATLSGAPASGLVERDSCIALMFSERRGPRLPAVGLVPSAETGHDRDGAGHVQVGRLKFDVDSHGQSRQCGGFLPESDVQGGDNP